MATGIAWTAKWQYFNPSQHLAGLGCPAAKTTPSLCVPHLSYAVESRVCYDKVGSVMSKKACRVSCQVVRDVSSKPIIRLRAFAFRHNATEDSRGKVKRRREDCSSYLSWHDFLFVEDLRLGDEAVPRTIIVVPE